MQLRDLLTFATIADHGNLHAAADALGVSQPALTKTVRRLETSLGVRLLERRPHGVALTEFGQTLRKRAALLQQVGHDVRAEIDDMKLGHSGRLRVGVVPAVLEAAIAPALARFLGGGRAVNFNVSVQLSGVLLRELRAGQLDLVVAAVPAEVPDDLAWRPLWKQQTHVVARRGHRLARGPFTLTDLARQRWLLPPADTRLRGWVEAMFVDAGIDRPSIFVETDATPAMFAALVRRTELVTVLTEDMLRSASGAGLVALPSPAASWTTPLGLFWRRAAYFSRLMDECRAAMEEIAAQRVA